MLVLTPKPLMCHKYLPPAPSVFDTNKSSLGILQNRNQWFKTERITV